MALWLIVIIIVLVILFAGVALVILVLLRPDLIDRALNPVAAKPPYQIDDTVRQNHQALFIVDLHADPLLWARDLLEEHSYGHVDLPRLAEGNVALQVFGLVTKYTVGLIHPHPVKGLDLTSALVWAQRWPSPTWKSPFQRALYQTERLKSFVQGSGGELMFVRSAQDIDQLVAGHASNPRLTGGLLSLEGVHALEGSLDNLDVLYDANVRMIGLTHFCDNEAGGASTGEVAGGLTPFGVDLVKKIQQKHMLVDLAHASTALIDDVLKITQAPVVVSHAGVYGSYPDNPRNLTDEHIKAVAATGGGVGIAMIKKATGGDTVGDAVRAMKYIADLVGVEHVVLGADYDGCIKAPMDATGLPLVTGTLLDNGFSLDDIRKMMGGNALRILKQVLPVN